MREIMSLGGKPITVSSEIEQPPVLGLDVSKFDLLDLHLTVERLAPNEATRGTTISVRTGLTCDSGQDWRSLVIFPTFTEAPFRASFLQLSGFLRFITWRVIDLGGASEMTFSIHVIGRTL